MFLKLSAPSLTHSTWEYLQNSLAHPVFDWRHHCLLAIFIHLVRASKHSAACWFWVNFSSMLCSLKVLVMSLKLLSWSLCGSLNKCCLHLGLVNLEDFCSSFFATSAAVRCFAEFQPVPTCHLYLVMYWYSHDSSQKREGGREFVRKEEDEIIQLHLATVFTYNLWQITQSFHPCGPCLQLEIQHSFLSDLQNSIHAWWRGGRRAKFKQILRENLKSGVNLYSVAVIKKGPVNI